MNKPSVLFAGILISILIIFTYWTKEDIPKTWDMEAIKKFHLPPPDSSVVISYAPEEYYNALPDHIIYKTFPVYVREFEPRGYLDSLHQLKPEVAFDPVALKTPEDWIKAGELVFNWPAAFRPVKEKYALRDLAHFRESKGNITKEGVYPGNRYVVAEEGTLLMGSLSCASCHTRILESGVMVPGAQGNVVDITGFAKAIQSGQIPFPFIQQASRRLYYSPWAPETLRTMPDSVNEFVQSVLAAPAGVLDRQGSGYLFPVAVPDLIGIKDIKYLDRTGLMKHDSHADLMRYAAFNQGMDMLTSYNGFVPGGKNKNSALPEPGEWNHPFAYVGKKYTDAQLYALTQYIYSLKPPENPHTFSKEVLARGKRVFAIAGCVTCHTPPLYTSNQLTPVNGFDPPQSHFEKYDIFNVSVETDSVSALYTRRGTGYYKIPSLRGVWYRSAFFHNGNLTTLDEVLDAKRLLPDFVPTGFRPPNVTAMAVKGHPFGLELNDADKKALIAFLKTL